jgi:hypothetical protein
MVHQDIVEEVLVLHCSFRGDTILCNHGVEGLQG